MCSTHPNHVPAREHREADIERLFPDPNHAGYIVIDWEVWEPWLNPHATTIYANKSFELAGGDIAAAVAAWNASSLKFMVRLLLSPTTSLDTSCVFGFIFLFYIYRYSMALKGGGCAPALCPPPSGDGAPATCSLPSREVFCNPAFQSMLT